MLRSILAIIAGSVTWAVTALGADGILMAAFPAWFGEGGRVESVPVLLLMMFYSLAFSALGGYVAAWLARRAEVKHAFILGVLQLAMGAVASYQMWDTAPAWWHLTFLPLVLPANVLGGFLRASRKRGPTVATKRLSAT